VAYFCFRLLQIGCRVLVFVFNYAQVASYCWMFVSGVYVTMLIAVPMKPTKCKFRSYVILGWGESIAYFALL